MELEKFDATGLGSLVNTKQVSPVEVIEYFANYIEETNYQLNAFVYLKIEEALEEARNLENMIFHEGSHQWFAQHPWFAGVPVALKDFLPSKKGWINSHGGVAALCQIDDHDSEFYLAARRLGAIAIGKTNAPSFGFRGTTDNKLCGPTKNPYNLEYNSGGSSGGSSSAVGGRLVPLAEGGDAGGSIRIPASWCNCFGFKPSAGMIPSVNRPDAWAATHPYCCSGPITRSVRDAHSVYEAMRWHNSRDPLSVPKFAHESSTIIDTPIKDLKIGYTFDFSIFPECDTEIRNAMLQVIDKLESELKVKCTPVTFQFKHSLQELEDAWLLGISIDDSLNSEIVKVIEEHPEDVSEEFLYWHERAKNATMLDYKKFHEIRTDVLDAHQEVFDNYDIILAPVTGCMPVKNASDRNTKGPQSINGQHVNDLIGFAYTYLENMIGTPAASVPIAIGSKNRPIGMQIIGRRYRDNEVFKVAYVLEELNPWNSWYDLAV